MSDLQSAILYCYTLEKENILESQELTLSLSDIEGHINDFVETAEKYHQIVVYLQELEKYREGVKQIKEQINNFKGCDMYDEANALELALEFLGVK